MGKPDSVARPRMILPPFCCCWAGNRQPAENRARRDGTRANPSGRRIRIGAGVFGAIRASTVSRCQEPDCAKWLTNEKTVADVEKRRGLVLGGKDTGSCQSPRRIDGGEL